MHTQSSSSYDSSSLSPPPFVCTQNVVCYVDQIERLHGYLTVRETIDFAYEFCRGGTHRGPWAQSGPEADRVIKELDEERWMVDLILRAVGVKRVADTFVGDDRVRGVSGGEKKRASVAEMMAATTCEFRSLAL